MVADCHLYSEVSWASSRQTIGIYMSQLGAHHHTDSMSSLTISITLKGQG